MRQENKRKKYGLLASVITIIGIAMIIMLCAVMDQLTDRLGWTVDLTADGRYAISMETKAYLEELNDNVSITVLVNEEEMKAGSYYMVQAYQNLLEYKKNSDKIDLKFVDLLDNPTFAAQYPDLKLRIYDILVESGDKQEVLSLQNMYEYDSTGSQITASKVEQMVTGALVEVTTDEKLKVDVLTGYSEGVPAELKQLLEANHFDVAESSLLTGELSEDAQMAILFAPGKDLEESSVKKIRTWLENDGEQGRNLFVFLDPNVTEIPNLEAFLEDWGIGLEEGYAFESNANFYYDKFFYPIAQYTNMDYAENMTSSDLTVMALCRPLEALFEREDNYETSVLLNFSPGSGTIKLGETQVTAEQITGDVKGMILSTHTWHGEEVTKSNIVVSGSALAFGGSLVSGTTFANGEYLLGVVQKLCDSSNKPVIEAKSLVTPNHTMSEARTNVYTWGFMVIAPLIVIVLGGVVWVRRRHR